MHIAFCIHLITTPRFPEEAERLVAQMPMTRGQSNYGTSTPPVRANTIGMSLPRYPTPVAPAHFNLKLPLPSPSQGFTGNEATSSGLMGRMRNAIGSLGLGNTRKGQASGAMNWNQMSPNMAGFNGMNFNSMMDQGLASGRQKMMGSPFITSGNAFSEITHYNSMPMSSLGMHPGECTIRFRIDVGTQMFLYF